MIKKFKALPQNYQMFAILLLLLLSNFLLRFVFDMHIQKHSVPYYFDQHKLNTDIVPWYYYMLPSNSKAWGGTWASLGIGLLPVFHKTIGNTNAFLLLNLIFVAVFYSLSWYAFRSRILTFTVGLCASFTTMNAHAYDNGSLVGFYLPLIFCFWNMFALFKLFETKQPKDRWWWSWALSLLLYMASSEGWVEYYATILILAPFCYFLLKKNKDAIRIQRLSRMLIAMTVVFVLFLYVKLRYTYASHPGDEHDLVFNYGRHYWRLIIEDIIGNFFTFVYMPLITYLPPQLTFSTALLNYGPQTIVALQNNYDAPYVYLAAINAASLWRFYAGVFVSIFVYYFWKVCKRLFTKFNRDYFLLFIFMSMVLISTPAHILVKYRVMHIVPSFFYQAFIGQIGMILLIAYGLFMLHRSGKTKKIIWSVSMIVWACIVVSAFTKNSFFQAGEAYGYLPQYSN